MNDYNTVEDFLLDDTFIEWIKRSNKDSVLKWDEWMKENKQKQELVLEAIALVDHIVINESLPQSEIANAAKRFERYLEDLPVIKRKPSNLYYLLSIAAIFLLVL